MVESGDELTLLWLRNAGSPYSVSGWSPPYRIMETRLDFILKIPAQTQWVLGPEAGYEAEDEDTTMKKVKDARTGNQQRGFRRGLETGTRLMINEDRLDAFEDNKLRTAELQAQYSKGVSYNNSGNPDNWTLLMLCFDICFDR